MNVKPDLELIDDVYNICVSKEGESVHLHDSSDEAEIYLSAEHFKLLAKLMGYRKVNNPCECGH